MPQLSGKVISQFLRDLTFEEIQALGGTVAMDAEGRAIPDRTVWVGGEIPWVTFCEAGSICGAVFTV